MLSSQSWPIRQQISMATPLSSASTKITFPRYVEDTLQVQLDTYIKHKNSFGFNKSQQKHVSVGHVQCDGVWVLCGLAWYVWLCVCIVLCVKICGKKIQRVVLGLWDCPNCNLFLFSSVHFHPVSTLMGCLLLNYSLTCFRSDWFLTI